MLVRDILKLDKFDKFRAVAGVNGLDRTIVRGGILDYESVELLETQFLESEFLLSNLPMIKDCPELIIEYVRVLIKKNVSGFAIKTSLFNELPKDAIELANKHDFPLFLFDDFYLDKLVLEIDTEIKELDMIDVQIDKINMIRDNLRNTHLVEKEVNNLNRYFCKNIRVYLLKKKNEEMMDMDKKLISSLLGKTSMLIPRKNDVLIIYTNENVSADSKSLFYKIGDNLKNYHVGVSSESSNHGLLGHLLCESEVALKYNMLISEDIICFNDIGIYQILIPMLNHPIQARYHKAMIDKIIEYDNLHNSELLDTAKAYIQSDGSVKATASVLFQHENTIRFRIRKLKEVVGYDDFIGMKYEALSIAIRLYELNQTP